MSQLSLLFLPHGTIKDLRISVEQWNGLVRIQFTLLGIAIEHGLEHITGDRENHLVAFEVLKCVHNFFVQYNLLRKCHISCIPF